MRTRLLALGAAAAVEVFAGIGRAATISVGSFTKSMAAAPAPQTVPHGLGETPKALLLWTIGDTAVNPATDYHYVLGATDGVASESASTASLSNSPKSDASRRIAYKLLSFVQWGETVVAEADFQSWDAMSFTINWTTNNGAPYLVHFIAIGGAEVSAKVKDWVMASNAPGLQSVTGIGFRPDLVLHVHCGAGFTLVPPASGPDSSIGLGMMDASGEQWHLQTYGVDNLSNSDTQRYQRSGVALAGIHSDLTVKKEASFASMDADGFTVNWTSMDSASSRVFSLALKGLEVRLGSFDKTTAAAPATQAVTGVGFRPQAVLLASFQDIARAVPVTQSRFGIGAMSAASQTASACTDADSAGTTNVNSYDKTTGAFIKIDNDTPAVDAAAVFSSLDADGFTLNWATNDPVATQILYLAIAPHRRWWLVD